MLICPECNVQLVKTKGSFCIFWKCPSCDGRSATISLLRTNVPGNVVNALWQTARHSNHPRKRRCPACNKLMAEVPAHGKYGTEHVDVCTVCQFVWFDSGEYDALPTIPREPTFEERLPQEAREKLLLLELESIREKARGSDWSQDAPDKWWQWIPGILGMPVEQENEQPEQIPWMTWSLVLMISIISLMAFFDLEYVIQNFGLIPAQLGRYTGLTFITSFLLHGGVLHLLSNMYFFLIFGDNVEDWLGKWRFILLIVCSFIVGDFIHIIGNPNSTIPCIGASGGISGIIAFYALKFPRARLGFLVRIYIWFKWIRMPAYAMFLIWVVIQFFGAWAQLAGFSNVSSLAHLGGASVGFIFWFLTRKK